jgi:FtsP/CotA-like multicopper oxidase with cupredoxin domain
MNASRRNFLQTAAAGVAAAAHPLTAADPYAPAEPGLAGQWFDKGRQHVLPKWAFDGYRPTPGVAANPARRLAFPATPAWVSDDKWTVQRGNAGAFGDQGGAPGKSFHGIAVEWNGTLIGGNAPGKTAWETMKERVLPTRVSEYKAGPLDTAKRNWAAYDDRVRCYRIPVQEVLAPLHPEAPHPALLYAYAGMVPGPTFRFRHGMPAVVRFDNQLQTEISVHHHGGHNPAHSDGFPSFYALQGKAKDYLYPNILPLRQNEGDAEMDYGEGQSTTWYHDHALDATAFNVSHGLAGFALWFDELELKLIRDGVLPGLGAVSAVEGTISDAEYRAWVDGWKKLHAARGPLSLEWAALMVKAGVVPRESALAAYRPVAGDAQKVDTAAREGTGKGFYHLRAGGSEPGVGTPYFNPYDLPIVLQDRIISRTTGQIVYDTDGHNGYIGDIQLANGRPWPAMRVKKRKYRLRLLDGSNARIYRLRFLDSQTFRLKPTADGRQEPDRIPAGTLEARSMDFFRIGKDSWLWPSPRRAKSVLLNMANRADLVVDFREWHEKAKAAGRLNADGHAEYYLVNTMPQFDGRGPKGPLAEDAGDPQVFPLPFQLNPANPVVASMVAGGVIPGALLGNGEGGQMTELEQPVGLIRFIIEDDEGEGPDAPAWRGETTVLRPRHAIKDEEVMAVREFVFERGKGAWMVNARFYDPTISNASPVIGIKGQKFRVPDGSKPEAERAEKESLTYAEEWILRNGGGGWWHPIHIHLEGHQLVGYEKDFPADGLIDADGILGAPAQAAMAPLPAWPDLVGRFGLDTLQAPQITNPIRDMLINPRAVHLTEEFRKRNPSFRVVLASPQPGASLFPALREGGIALELEKPAAQPWRAAINRILDALSELRNSWAGEMTGNHDTQALGPNTVARIRMRFRTWNGPFVFHCHNVEHEDMRMMFNFEPVMRLTGPQPGSAPVQPNTHDPNVAPAARTHGQDVTDLRTNPNAVGEMPWEKRDGFPHFHEDPVPFTPTDRVADPLIRPRPQQQ